MKIVELQASIFDIRDRRCYQMCQGYDAGNHSDDGGEEAEDVGDAGEGVVHIGGDCGLSALFLVPSAQKQVKTLFAQFAFSLRVISWELIQS